MPLMRQSSASPRLAGFTLVEVLVAMLTLAIGLSGNYLLFARSMQQQQHGTYQSRAAMLARSVGEDLRSGRVAALADPVQCASPDPDACAAVYWLAQVRTRWGPIAAQQLPRASLVIDRSASGDVTVTLQWQDALSLRPSLHQHTVAPT